MKYFKYLSLTFCILSSFHADAQKILPGITVKNIGGKIVVSWQNAFTKPVTDIFIQRSYDSLKNYTTIGSVLNPQSRENGYADPNPPYNKMYYRVSISFQGGDYTFSTPERPVKDIPVPVKNTDSTKNNQATEDEIYPWLAKPGSDSIVLIAPPKKENEITYPSEHIFATKDNNIIIHLPEAAAKKYLVKFYDETDNFLFELTRLNEEYLILEKVNFVRSGWFHFELYENGKLIEKNKFQIVPKEMKGGNK